MAEPALAKVICITKDETDLVEDFVDYHAHLFGYRNIVLVDNGSTDAAVLAAYDRMRDRGVDIRTDARPFSQATEIMTEHMRSLCDGSCEWILPLETDEFFVWLPTAAAEAPVPCDTVRGYLRGLPEDVVYIGYGLVMASVVDASDVGELGYHDGAYARPAEGIVRFAEQGWDKYLVRARAFDGVLQWNHHARLREGYRVRHTSRELGVLHFHNTGARRRYERALRVLEGCGALAPKLPLWLQAYHLDRMARSQDAHAHKAVYVLDVVVRRLLADAFVAVVDRLPSEAELHGLVAATGKDGVFEGGMRALFSASKAFKSAAAPVGAGAPAAYALLFPEADADANAQPGVVVLRQVRETLRCQKGPIEGGSAHMQC